MGNLDFLEKKPRIAYTLSWDGVTDGKVTNTSGTSAKLAYKISDEIFIADPIIDDVNSVSTLKVPKNIDIVDAFYAKAFGSDSKGTCLVYPVVNDAEFAGKNGAYQFDLYFKDEESDSGYVTSPIELYYILVANKEIPAPFGNVNPKFPEKGWYIYVPSSITYTGDLMSVLKDPLVQFSYSGKGFTSPKKPYSYASRSFDSDDVISIFYDPNIIPDTDEAKSKGFNAICAPGDWNTKADIKLNKDLADILKAGHIGCLNFYINNDMPFVVEGTPVVYRPFISISYENINSIGGLCIREIDNGNITVIYFNPSISLEEFNMWANKYFLSEP